MSFPEFLNGDGDDRITGVAIGIVTDNEDPEGMGRVKLSFPWRDAEDESYWARMATPMAGTEMGTYFLPEVGDEVLVAFEDGDIHYPYVLGALWNGKEKPPEDNADGNNDVRLIRSRSGHEIVLDDSDSAPKIEITTNGGHTIVMDDSSGGEKVEIEAGGNTITLDSTGNAIEISGDTIELSGNTKVSISAPMLELKSDGNANVEASGMLTLKGAIIQLN